MIPSTDDGEWAWDETNVKNFLKRNLQLLENDYDKRGQLSVEELNSLLEQPAVRVIIG